MGTGTTIIIGMAVATVASAVTQKILMGAGKTDEAQFMDITVKSLLAATALGIFAGVIKAIKNLG